MKNIAIIGSGSFGCALSYVFSKNNNVKIWSYKEEEMDLINNEHKSVYIDELLLDSNIKCSLDLEDVIPESDIIVLVSPSEVFEETCLNVKKYYTNQDIIIATKGFYKNRLLSDIAKEIIGVEPYILTGPSHAEQMVKDELTYVSLNNKDLIDILSSDNFKIEYSDDPIGLQVGGTLKNVIALGTGICEGLGHDSNFISYFVTKGLEEIKEITVSLGGKQETIYGIAGLGDLLVTSFSNHSRNKKAGILLGQGKTIEDVKEKVGMVIEGLNSLESAYEIINKYNIDSKIIKNIYNFVYGDNTDIIE